MEGSLFLIAVSSTEIYLKWVILNLNGFRYGIFNISISWMSGATRFNVEALYRFNIDKYDICAKHVDNQSKVQRLIIAFNGGYRGYGIYPTPKD